MDANVQLRDIVEKDEFQDYTKVKKLGKGAYGKAILVKRNVDDFQFVMKQIDFEGMDGEEVIKIL